MLEQETGAYASYGQGWIFFSYLTDFSYFICEKKSESCRKLSEQFTNDLYERGCRWFQLFYFLIRTIPVWTHCSILFYFLTLFSFVIYRLMQKKQNWRLIKLVWDTHRLQYILLSCFSLLLIWLTLNLCTSILWPGSLICLCCL